ncbi:hypothetical protein KR032_001946, partial [Drosophila birchii]
VRILQINLNHCEAAHDLLSQTFRDTQSDVALISEPYRRTPGPEYALDTTRTAEVLTRPPNRSVQQRIGSYFVRATVKDLCLYSCYLPPRLTLLDFAAVLDEVVDDARGKRNVIIAGDFNAWATEWGSSNTNSRGRTLLEAFASLDGSVVDLTFCSNSVFQRARWRLSDLYTASDHKAIICDISNRAEAIPARKRFNPKTFQREAFFRELQHIGTREHAECSVASIMGAVKSACRASMKEARSYLRHLEPVYWWTQKIAEARNNCLRVRRAQQRARGRQNLELTRLEFANARRSLKK